MEKAKNSPLGLKEDWSAKVEKAFESGLVRVPPQATRFVLASQIDFEFMEPLWTAAVIELERRPLDRRKSRKMRHGTPDTIEGLPAIVRPNDTYIVKFAPKTGRRAWRRQTAKRSCVGSARCASRPRRRSRRICKRRPSIPTRPAATSSWPSIWTACSRSSGLPSISSRSRNIWTQWGADLPQLAKLLDNVQGIRIGVRIGEEPSGMIVIDVRGDASMASNLSPSRCCCRSWRTRAGRSTTCSPGPPRPKGHEISLAGKLSKSGLRRLLSVVDSPAGRELGRRGAGQPRRTAGHPGQGLAQTLQDGDGNGQRPEGGHEELQDPRADVALVRQVCPADRTAAHAQRGRRTARSTAPSLPINCARRRWW